MEGALIEANAELRTIMKRIWKSAASDKVCTLPGLIIKYITVLGFQNIKMIYHILINSKKVLDKLVPPPSDPACQDDDIAVGKFYATVLIQVMVSFIYIVFQYLIIKGCFINMFSFDIQTGLF